MGTHEEAWPAGTPCWVDITVSDLAESEAFYSSVLGWEFAERGRGGRVDAVVGGRRVAGLAPPTAGEDWPHVWTTYFATDDVDATGDAALGAGGKPVVEPAPVGALGRGGLWVDTEGAMFGGWEAGEHTGFQAHHEHGAVGWIDLTAPDIAASKAFYHAVFGFEYEDISLDHIPYALFTAPGQRHPGGGIGGQQSTDRRGPRWCVTFEVDDVDASRQRVLDAAGGAAEDPEDFEFGRIVNATGPDGEEFSLVTSTPDGH